MSPWWQRINRHDLLALILLISTGLGVYATLVLPLSLQPLSPLLHAGQAAPQSFQAPKDAEYISTVRTEQARDAAERNVLPVYSLPDPAIARRQIAHLRTALDYIG